jgi:hypothetical protein
MTEPAPDLNATDARQGRRGRHAFVILITSLALVVIAFAAVFLAHARKLSGPGGQDRAPAQVAQGVSATTPSTVKQTASTAPPGSVAAQATGPSDDQRAAGG